MSTSSRLSSNQNIKQDDIKPDISLPQINKDTIRQAALLQIIRIKNKQIIHPSAAIKFHQVTIQLRKGSEKERNCNICKQNTKINENYCIAYCIHADMYCELCLHQYSIYCVEQSNKITCPSHDCGQQLNMNGLLFKSLPAKIQIKYREIKRLGQELEHPFIKMCFRESCKGIINFNQEEQRMNCINCKSEFCTNCFLLLHEGKCDQYQQQFFQKTLKYQQCKNCKTIINKFEGRNHLKCACLHQFCYVCGADWSPAHFQDHNQNGVFDPIQNIKIDYIAPIIEDQNNEPAETEEQRSKRKRMYLITFLPRLIISIILFSFIIALFPLVVVAYIILLMGYTTKRKSQSDKRCNKKISDIMDNMCEKYFSLFCKVVEAFLKFE